MARVDRGGIFVLLPARVSHLAARVLEAGCVPVIDGTGAAPPVVPDGAWVRTRAGRPAPGTGPVVLAEFGAPIPDRPTWLESAVPREIPRGYAGLVLKGREAGGLHGEEDGLVALARCADPSRILLDAGLGPDTAAAAAALGAHGVMLVEPHLGLPELDLAPGLVQRLLLGDDEISTVIGGIRVANSPVAPVLQKLLEGEDPWELTEGLYTSGDPLNHLWMAGQGLALARELADRFGSLAALLAAYRNAFENYAQRQASVRAGSGRPVGTAAALAAPETAAVVGGTVGSGVLWQEARFLQRAIVGGDLRAAAATGAPVVADEAALTEVRGGPAVSEPAPAAVVAGPVPAPPASTVAPEARPAIAIIGIGCLFPGGSNSPEQYWKNIVDGKDCIGLVPPDRWDANLFYDENHDTPDRTYARIGGFLEGFEFEPKRFRIPPRVASSVDPVQQITLTAVGDALRDAGLQVDSRDKEGRPFDRERCAVILGNSLGGEMGDRYAIRLAWPEVRAQLLATPTFAALDDAMRARVLEELEVRYKADLPEITEDSMPGELANVIAGRITNAFDLGGANYTVDAACASSMAAIDNSIKALIAGDVDLAITGGADRSMNIATYVKFCKIGALSPDHSSPFDASANGFVMGEGAGILVLKRFEDAVRDADRIYAVIRGVGASSDGKGKGITAPNIVGQIRALERAYAAAGVDPKTVDLIEAHGTSTVVGDRVEVEALGQVIGSGTRGERGPMRLGSVKSMIGHLKSAAGAASCIKTALALHHGVMPPSLGFHAARPEVPLDTIPLKVVTTPEPWPATPDGLRRAGVSAFGFGGTNFHVVMESYGGQTLPSSPAMTAPLQQAPVPLERRAPVAFQAPPRAPAVAPAAPVATTTPPAPAAPPAAPRAAGRALPKGIWAVSAADTAEAITQLEALAAGQDVSFHPSSPLRIAAAYDDDAERIAQIERTLQTLRKGSNPEMLRGRGIHLEDSPVNGKLALLFTGQGSQYADMGLDLAAEYPVVQATFDEADAILTPSLGRSITSFIRLEAGENVEEKEAILKRTEYSQPATLTLDIAILRLLSAFGIQADMVAGHSLGEYGAGVAAGVLTFEDSLRAVTARGREMANIHLEDPGKMAGIAARTEVVEEVLAEVGGYVIAANKNCPTQTVIAGASDAVDEAVEMFRARGITVHPLPVSHAFHSKIVAPASEPLRGVLAKMDLRKARVPITTNVTGEWYPDDKEAIVDLLAEQIWSPVEWVAQTERMYEAGARMFVEVGPKRALAGFTVAILKRRPHRAHYTNHPKHGGVRSFRDALAGLIAAGFPVRAEPGEVDIFATPEARLATTDAIEAASAPPAPQISEDVGQSILAIVARSTGYDPEELDLDYELEADLGIDTVKQAEVFSQIRDTFQIPEDPDFDPNNHKTLRSLIEWAGARTGSTSYRQPTAAAAPSAPAPAPAPAPTPTGAPVSGIDAEVLLRFLESATEAGLAHQGADAFARALLPAVQSLITAAYEASQVNLTPYLSPALPEVVCSGASLGLPGGTAVFDEANLVSILRGENRIEQLGERSKAFLDKGIVRLVKDPQTGQGSFLPVETLEQVIRLAGVRQGFDLTEWGADPAVMRAMDITTQLAIAAGYEALRDAGIPMVRGVKTSAGGKPMPGLWQLPTALQDTTGVIFASAFPGIDQHTQLMLNNADDGEGRFDRRFLFQILALGHSQFAQLICARGPSAAVNGACASTTQAIGIASDWIRLGRCERVIVIGADDVTSETMLPWMGSAFMAAGAASTKDEVTEAALPFDARRHGMILGMGAVGMVLERSDLPAARGTHPIATLLANRFLNSAFHGSRLDIQHIAQEMKGLIQDACRKEGRSAAEIASEAFFMSHETFTPARGGSAAAEIHSLREAFGDAASAVTIANTKGFTGHAMGAGIEDTVALKALQYGIVPPLANLKQPDEELGSLRLSTGEIRDFRYAVRLAAGFGSQLALTVWRRESKGDDRVANPALRAQWLHQISGFAQVEERIEQRTLRVYEAPTDKLRHIAPNPSPASLTMGDFVRSGLAPSPAPVAAAPVAAAPVATPVAAEPAYPKRQVEVLKPVPASGDVLGALLGIIAEKTGYETDELEPDFELEADLGIDTVKQAEVLSEITEHYHLGQDDEFRLADYPTIEKLAAYVQGRLALSGVEAPAAAASAPVAPVTPVPPVPDVSQRLATPSPAKLLDDPPASKPAAAPAAVDGGEIQRALLEVIAEKTGYEVEELELDFELEADLGIDTVKQAEVLSELRERFGVGQDDDFRLADYPTIEALAAYLTTQVASGPAIELVEMEELDVDADPPREPLPFGTDPEPGETDPTLAPVPSDSEELYPEITAAARTAPRGNVPLPPSFRLRRPVLVPRAAEPAEQGLIGFSILVIGEGALADRVREEIGLRSGSLDGPFDTVIDLGDDALAAFRVARSLDRDRPARWLTVTRMGGFEPRSGDIAWTDGARAGFTKALGREWDECSSKTLDLDPQLDLETVAARVCDELQTPFDQEVFVHFGQRHIVRYKTEVRPHHQGLKDTPVIVITGGARGICARIAEEFAKRGPCHLVLIGRSAVPGQAFDLDAEKARIKEELTAAGDRATPANIEKQLGKMRSANEAVATLELLRGHAGVKATYIPCDLSDVVAAANMIRDVHNEHGRLDICIHGAGVEESRLIHEKDEQAWHRVFDGKANGGRAILDVLSEDAFFVSMGSVAGRFGNPGQVDYAAANDAMARRCLARPNALHVDWTAWDDVGMAAGSAMKRVLQERGVELLPADAGADLLVDMVLSGMTGELVVAGRLGDFQTDPGHPLLDRVEMDGDIIRGYRELTVLTDPWIADHAIDGVPVLPGVIGLELMVSVACLVRPEALFVGAKDIKFDSPVKVHGDQSVLLVVEAEPMPSGNIEARLIAVRVLRTGRVRRHQHFSATICLGELETVEPLPSAFLPDEVLDQSAIYSRFFHGPIFQVLDGVFGISQDGLVAEASTEPDNIAADLISAPLALEAAFQSAGLHRMAVDGVMALPMAVRELRFHETPPAGTTFSITVREVGGAYDIDVDALNTPIMRVRGFAMVELGPLPPGDRIPEPKDPRPMAFPPVTAGGARSSGSRASADEPWQPWLTPEEHDEVTARGTARRQRDRIAGRIAAKRALHGLTGVPALDIRLSTAPSGQPLATVPGWPGVSVSVSHSEGEAVALAVDQGHVGIDREVVLERPGHFAAMWLSEAERALAPDPLRQTLVWCAKEAVLKALGTGMAIHPRHVQVKTVGQDRLTVVLDGPARERLAALGASDLRVSWTEEGETHVIVRADLLAA